MFSRCLPKYTLANPLRTYVAAARQLAHVLLIETNQPFSILVGRDINIFAPEGPV